MNIAAIGGERFEIISINHQKPYLEGAVHNIPLQQKGSIDQLFLLEQMLRSKINNYINMLHAILDNQFSSEDIPTDPIGVGYFGAWALQVPVKYKQKWLVINNGIDLLQTLSVTYQLEICLVHKMINHARDQSRQLSLFSLN